MGNELRTWMPLAETQLPEGFVKEDDMLRFTCPFGSGVVSANDRACAIYEFQSQGELGRGNGRRTLQWLHQQFDVIDVIDPGEEGTDARQFWEKMRDEGLVDGLYNEEWQPV